MSEPRAIDGDYADFKLVRTRKVCQVVVEFPIERAAEVTELIGWPKPGGNVRCAVALLEQNRSDREIGRLKEAMPVLEPRTSEVASAPSRDAPSAIGDAAATKPPWANTHPDPWPTKPLGDAPAREDGEASRAGTVPRSASATSPAKYTPPGWADMKPAARAAVWCKMPLAWKWLNETGELDVCDEASATAELKTRLGISSRAEIVEGSRAAAELSRIIGAFHAWRDYRESVR